MIEIILGLLGAGAMLGGSAVGESMRNWEESQRRSHGGGDSGAGGATGSSPSYGHGSWHPEDPVWRFNKRTGEMERL